MNKYLEKIAALSLPKFNGRKERDVLDLLGFGMSATGLAMGTSRTLNAGETNYSAKKKQKLEEQSLETLKSINRNLKKLPKAEIVSK